MEPDAWGDYNLRFATDGWQAEAIIYGTLLGDPAHPDPEVWIWAKVTTPKPCSRNL